MTGAVFTYVCGKLSTGGVSRLPLHALVTILTTRLPDQGELHS